MYDCGWFIKSIYNVNEFKPWEILDNLRKWSNFIYDSFATLLMWIPLEKQEELREKGK